MIRISDLKLKPEHRKEDLNSWLAKILHIEEKEIVKAVLVKESIDARKKPQIFLIRVVDVEVKNQKELEKRLKKQKLQYSIPSLKSYPYPEKQETKTKVVVVGSGPAGLFCSYFLALAGQEVVLLERGKPVEDRAKDVELFWKTGELLANSNVSFGEGGAGTFSDGKLNTLVKDKTGRNYAVLETFVKFGANPAILYEAKPHVGTDVLQKVVHSMRVALEELGVKVCFETCMTKVLWDEKQKVTGVELQTGEIISCDKVVLAIGHSARDTFYALKEQGLVMEPKAFAVGFRVEHPQDMMNVSQYGEACAKLLPAAPYKVATKTSVGRNVYSFCMCPGGYVVNASSEPGRLAVNGMSYSGRDGANANSAIIINVEPEDFPSKDVLAGVEFQRTIEERAYLLGGGKIPCAYYGDFRSKVRGEALEPVVGTFPSETKGTVCFTDLTSILTDSMNHAFVEGMETFGRQIEGFNRPDAIMLGIESRTSSPVRIPRNETMEANISGIYPCGEGAGYAGGIMSAAMDGMKVAEQIIQSLKS